MDSFGHYLGMGLVPIILGLIRNIFFSPRVVAFFDEVTDICPTLLTTTVTDLNQALTLLSGH